MRTTLIGLALVLAAASAGAQSSEVSTNRSTGNSGFSIGPRISNYATRFNAGETSVKTGRQSGFGVAGDYRTGDFIFDFMGDRDPENGLRLTDLIIGLGRYERTRGEATIGYAFSPSFDLQAGVRYDDFRLNGTSFFGNPFFSDLEVNHQALTGGVHLHTRDFESVGYSVTARAYGGTADFSVTGPGVNDPSTYGIRVEGAVSLRIGRSQWYAVPGLEYEKLTSEDEVLDLDTNRIFIKVMYKSRR
jgi:hypothetical protein